MTTKNQNRENGKSDGNDFRTYHNQTNTGLFEGVLSREAELDFAAAHLNRVKNLNIKSGDVVLVAIPMSEHCWLEVIDACIYAGADFVIIDPVEEMASLAETVEWGKINVVATMRRVSTYLHSRLITHPGEVKSLRVIHFNDRGEPEFQVHEIPAVLSK